MNTHHHDQARTLFERALQALQQGQPQEAETALLACLQLVPGRVSPLVALGAARLRLNRANEALQALDQALAQEPTRSDAWGHRADALLRLGRHAEALQALDHADARRPPPPGTARRPCRRWAATRRRLSNWMPCWRMTTAMPPLGWTAHARCNAWAGTLKPGPPTTARCSWTAHWARPGRCWASGNATTGNGRRRARLSKPRWRWVTTPS